MVGQDGVDSTWIGSGAKSLPDYPDMSAVIGPIAMIALRV